MLPIFARIPQVSLISSFCSLHLLLTMLSNSTPHNTEIYLYADDMAIIFSANNDDDL